jgi:hypothetical protein
MRRHDTVRKDRREQREDLQRIDRLKSIVCVGLAVCFLIAPAIWLERPFFTPLPIAGGLRPLPPPLDLIALVALLALLAAVVLVKRRELVFAWVLLFALRTLWDRATWQPFLLMYAFLLFTTAFASWGEAKRDRGLDAAVLNTSRFVVIAVYILSGASKVSYGFVHYVLPELLAAVGDWLPIDLLVRFGLFFPLSEFAIALGLLFPRTRGAALIAAILMHAFILVAVGPFGQSYNAVVWPWNVAMIAILLVIFRGASDVGPRAILLNRGFPLHAAAIALFAVLPGLSYVGLWPTYLSFRLYSEQYHWATISLTPAVRLKLPPRTRDQVMPTDDGRYDGYLKVVYWSEHELGAFVPPEPWVFREVARRVCALAGDPRDVRLTIEDPPDRWTAETTETTTYCDEL